MAFANDKPARSITWPPGARSGDTRIVAGADTPDELLAQNISVAILFYAEDNATGLEMGYFFIGVSNIYDIDDQKSLLFGSVMYPVPGNPDSATSTEVKVHHQINLGHPGLKYTVFKNVPFLVQSSVGSAQFNAPILALNDLFIYDDSQLNIEPTGRFRTDLGSATVFAGDQSYEGWPIGASRAYVKPVHQGTNVIEASGVMEYDQHLYTGLPLQPGQYSMDFDILIFGAVGFAAGGTISKYCHRLESTQPLTNFSYRGSGPPDTTANYGFPGNIGSRNFSTNTIAAVIRHGVNTAATNLKMTAWFEVTVPNTVVYLKFCKDAATVAGDVQALIGSSLIVKRWA